MYIAGMPVPIGGAGRITETLVRLLTQAGGRLQVEPVVHSATALEWSIIAASLLTLALLIVIVRHAVQVAAFALRKEVH